ncbi:response regulator transcription factor [Luteolibacter soli]|uniref:Response regulator n=1 Tax=Luteolibacter soli TaxID=3135280 RepID=A0ABU9ANS9_9BACT
MNANQEAGPVVYLVDDDESLRTALSRLLRAAGHETRSYGSAAEFLLARKLPLRGCLLLDVRIPGGPSGLELHRGLRDQEEMLPVIFITGHGDIPMSVQAIKAGAFDFLPKPVQRETLLATVAAALEHDAARWEAAERRTELGRRLASLSPCEHEVLLRVVAGQPNKQIGAEVGCSERTVKAHRSKVMQKMGATSLAELVHMADDVMAGAAAGSH